MNDTITRDLAFSSPMPVVRTRLKGKDVYFVVLDGDIAQRLGVDEERTKFAQAITEHGLVLKLVRSSDE